MPQTGYLYDVISGGVLITGLLIASVNPPLWQQRTPKIPQKADLQLWRALDLRRVVYGDTRRPVYVRAQDDASLELMEQFGVKVKRGQWIPARLTSSELLSAMSAGDGLQLRSTKPHRTFLDRSLGEMNADLVQAGYRVDLPRTGKGVLVGIIDTGLDLNHPAFYNSEGNLRVVAYWDQDAYSGSPPLAYGYGNECNERQLRDHACRIADRDGHGTHVTGISAGNRGLGGVAPDAEIAVVRSDDFTQIADAVSYLSNLAYERDMPLVVNISVGGQYGPHDGRTPLETFLDDKLGDGRIVVAAAGNDGNSRVHIGTSLGSTERRVELKGLPYSRPVDSVFELWTKPTHVLHLALELWRDNTLLKTYDLASHASEYLEGEIRYAGEHIGTYAFNKDYEASHKLALHNITINRQSGTRLGDGMFLALRLSGDGYVHGWASQSSYGVGNTRFGDSRGAGWISGDGASSIAVPASGRRVLGVGAYTVRRYWGEESTDEQAGSVLGILAPFSSVGPTSAPSHTGVKPDFAAPGSVIVSARAASVPPLDDHDPDRVVMQGTSMSSPHVAGVIALMLEANPWLSPEEARDILRKTTRMDEHTGSLPNDSWGYGKIDAWAAVQLTERQQGPSGCTALGVQPWFLLAGLVLALRGLRRRR